MESLCMTVKYRNHRVVLSISVAAVALSASLLAPSAQAQTKTLTGQDAFTDYSKEHPGVRRKITPADLPQPKPDESVRNTASVVARPEGAWPIAPPGFKVELY